MMDSTFCIQSQKIKYKIKKSSWIEILNWWDKKLLPCFVQFVGYFNAKISISSANCLNPLTSMSLGSRLIKLAPISFVNCFSSHLTCPCQWRYSNGQVTRRAVAIGFFIGVYYALKDKLGAARKFKVIDRLLMQMKRRMDCL